MQYGQSKPGLNFHNIRSFKLPHPPLGSQEEFAQVIQTPDERHPRQSFSLECPDQPLCHRDRTMPAHRAEALLDVPVPQELRELSPRRMLSEPPESYFSARRPGILVGMEVTSSFLRHPCRCLGVLLVVSKYSSGRRESVLQCRIRKTKATSCSLLHTDLAEMGGCQSACDGDPRRGGIGVETRPPRNESWRTRTGGSETNMS